MSAFIVSKEHINYLIQAAISRRILGGSDASRWFHAGEWHELRPGDSKRASQVGQILWNENVKSVATRYDEAREDRIFAFSYNHKISIDPVQVLKACHCLNYQSCEHETWEASEAYAFLESLKSDTEHALPGYDEAQAEEL